MAELLEEVGPRDLEWPSHEGRVQWWWDRVQAAHENHSYELVLVFRHMGSTGLRILSQAALPCIGSQLRILNLRRIDGGADGIRVLAMDGLSQCSNLVHLNLGRNMIPDEGIESLADHGLRHLPILEELHLDGNVFGDAGLEALAYRGLEHCPKLTQLALQDNNIGDAGMEALVDRGLRHCGNVTYINVENNSIGDKGIMALSARGLPLCLSLTHLWLGRNNFGAQGAMDFVKALADNPPRALQVLRGIRLEQYVDTLSVPESLCSEVARVIGMDVVILDFLRKHPADLCRQLCSSDELQHDKSFVIAAVKQHGRAIRYASAELRADKEVILRAVESTGNRAFAWETEADVYAELESFIDPDVVQRMRTWVEHRHGAEVAQTMSFREVHAQYVGFPGGTEEDRIIFEDLGWAFLETLDAERHGQAEGDDASAEATNGGND